MKQMVFFVTIAFLLCASLMIMPVQVYAQKHITVINPSFEKPDSGKIEGFNGKTTNLGSGFKVLTVPGWTVDSPDSSAFDSGIEPKAGSVGAYDAWLMAGDSGIYQILNRRFDAADQLQLTVAVRMTYPQTGQLWKMELFYNDGDSLKGTRMPVAMEVKALPPSDVTLFQDFSITFNVADNLDAVGHNIGILLDNVSPDSASWTEFDNVRLTNLDPTIIEVPNYSFELPDSGKIEGWNGPGSCPDKGNYPDVPNWATDDTVTDSGVEGNTQGGDGAYEAFFSWQDEPAWNTTDYTILAGDDITLNVNARASWLADQLHLELYYVDASNVRQTLVSDDPAMVDPGHQVWSTFTVEFAANTIPACIGQKLGVALKNSSLVANSWAGMDLVRVNANHSVTGVTGKLNPNKFSLAQNYPNPFNPTTNISYTLQTSGKIRLSVYDILGREVAVLANENQIAGSHQVKFAASALGSGVYFYKLQSPSGVITKKMLLLK